MGGSYPVVLQGEGSSGGKVGIGFSDPEGLLHVGKISSTYTGIFGVNVSNYNTGTNVTIGDNSTSAYLFIGQDVNHKGFLGWNYNATPALSYFTIGSYSGSHPLILQGSGGGVGIGTTNPVGKLEVDYNADSKIYLGHSTAYSSLFYKLEKPESGDGQTVVLGYRDRNTANPGANYAYYSVNSGVMGYSNWGDLYSFGTAGYNYNDLTRCGGMIGGEYYGAYWGAMGYKNSSSNAYGGYFTSSGSGAGKSPHTSVGVGIGAWGDLLGADIHGKVYGIYAEGQDYALYSNGPVYKNDLDIHLQKDVNGNNTVLYTSVTTEVTIQTCGQAVVSNGKADVVFDEAFAAAVSAESPIIVTVTPLGSSKGVYLQEVSKGGFKLAENEDGKSNLTCNYIAVGKRAGYEHPVLATDVVNSTYTEKIADGLHNDADLQSNGQGLYYESGKLSVGVHPAMLTGSNKPSTQSLMPKPGIVQPVDPSSRPAAECSGGYIDNQPVTKPQKPGSESPADLKLVNRQPPVRIQQPALPGAHHITSPDRLR